MNTVSELLITREREFILSRSSEALLSKLEAAYSLIYLPLMRFSYNSFNFDEIFSSFESSTFKPWVLLTSGNSIASLNGIDCSRCRFAVIGSSTADMIEEAGYVPEFVSSTSNAEAFGTEFFDKVLEGNPAVPLILLQGNTADSTMQDFLSTRSERLLCLTSYEVKRNELSEMERDVLIRFLDSSFRRSKERKRRNSVLFLSALQGNYFIEECHKISSEDVDLSDLQAMLTSLRIFSIGGKTSESLQALGFKDIVTAGVSRVYSVLDDIIRNDL